MPDFVIEPGTASDYAGVLALNELAVPHVNLIDSSVLERLHQQSAYFGVARAPGAAEPAGFLLALAEGADYQSLNYRYFQRNYPRFVYVDRIVIGETWRRAGIGQALYADLLEQMRTPADSAGPMICCEVNVRPPNPGSLAFHKRMGFVPVGEQDTEGGSKRVCLLVREPAQPTSP